MAILLLGNTHVASAVLGRPSSSKEQSWGAVGVYVKQQHPYAWSLAAHKAGELSRFMCVHWATDTAMLGLESEWEIVVLCHYTWIPGLLTHEVSSQAR